MLETLRIKNFALIDQVDVEFRPGFNVLTGETGAGKSILVGALNLILGARASSEAVRDGADNARIDAVFRIPQPSQRLAQVLEEHGIERDDDALVLARTLSADGRSRGYAGGAIVPISVLAAIGDELVDLHGQHEHQSLLKPDRQLELLDAFAGTEATAAAVADEVAALRSLESEIAALESDDRDRARQVEFLKFEADEIAGAALEPDEEQTVRTRLNLINNSEAIYRLAGHANTLLYSAEEGSAIDAVDAAARDLDELAAIDERFASLSAQLAEARAGVEAVAEELRDHAEQLEFDPEELERLNQRLALIGNLKRKYGGTVEEILAYHARAVAEIDAYEQRDERLDELRARRRTLETRAREAADKLSRKRQSAARKLDKRINATLGDLGMKGGSFATEFETSDLGSHGIDRVTFLLTANPGEAPKPLRQVASGGEISRIMLALKVVFADADRIPSLVFDEIDAGVGGGVAVQVADKLTELAGSHQVICITHLPQIAAGAAAHFTVAKRSAKGRTISDVAPITDEARVREMARLLDGSVSEVSIEHARTLLAAKT